jgi:glycosyltransferase involved in cell wall biosynthesis
MTNVAFLITELDRGGAERALVRLATGLDRTRFRPFVFSLTDEGPLAKPLSDAGIPVCALKAHVNPLKAVLEFVKALRDIRPYILQTFLFHANVVGRLAGRMAGVPRIVSSIRVCEVDRPWRTAIDRLTHAGADRITCVANAVREFTRRASGIPSRKLIVIPNGIDVSAAAARPQGPMRFRALTVANLRRQKGIDVLLRAIPRVRQAHPEAVFTVVGRGDPTPYVRMADALGIRDAVRWAGEADPVAPFFRDADLFVLPSRWEGCPNVVLEAMAAGLPVVATDAGGTPELVVDGVTGFLVHVDSPVALGNRIVELMRDPERAARMGAEGRARAASKYGDRLMIGSYATLYDQLRNRR